MLKCDKTTQMIMDFGDWNIDELVPMLERFVLNGEYNDTLYECFREWVRECSLDLKMGSELILYSTVFPLRVFMSINRLR